MLRKWDILREMSFILQIPLQATIELQKHDIGLSDVYSIWTRMQLHLKACLTKKNYKTALANHLIKAIHQRNDMIFANPFMGCALFLDPRFRHIFIADEIKKENAKLMLSNIWQRMKSSESIPSNGENANTSEISFQFDAHAALNTMMQTQNSTSDDQGDNNQIESILNSFNPERLSCEKSVLEFWENSKLAHPELYELAMVVYAVPPSEVQVERDFSRLNFIFSDRRCRLQEDRLHDIMLISLNPQIFYSVRDEELEELKRSLIR